MSWVIKFDTDNNGTYETTVVGAVITEIMQELNGHEEARFDIPNNAVNRGYITSNVGVQISFSGTSIFEGICTGGEYEPGLIECFAYDKVFELMQRRVHTGTYNSELASDILDQICLSAGVTANFIAAGFPGGIPPTLSVRFDKAICYDAAVFLASACVGDQYSSGGNTFNIIKTRGSDKGVISTISISRRGIDRAKQRDKVWVIGVDDAGNKIEASYGAGSNVVVFREKKASSMATLQNLAQDYYNQLNTSSSGAKIVVPITDGYDIYPGDTVTINDAMYSLSGSYRIWKITKKIGEVELEVDKAELSTDRVIDEMRNLEELGIYIISTTSMPTYTLPWNSDLTFEPYNPVGIISEHNCCRWGAPYPNDGNIHFSDGSDQEILAGSSNLIYGGFADGTTYYLYFTIGDNTLNITTNYQIATDVGCGIVAKVFVSTDSLQQVSIETYYSGGQNVISDDLGDGSAVQRVISADQIYGKDIRSDQFVGEAGGPAGVRMTGTGALSGLAPGIYGYSGGTNKTFYLRATDGKAMAANGKVIFDSNGVTIYDNGNIIFRLTAGDKMIGAIDSFIAAGPWGNDRLRIWGDPDHDVDIEIHGHEIYIVPFNAAHNIIIGPGRTYMTFTDVSYNLRIPRYNGFDPVLLASGDIWLRTDL